MQIIQKIRWNFSLEVFFIITRRTYEAVGTQAVKSEIVEDGALGRKVKEEEFKLKVVRGERNVEAIWARDVD